MPPASVSRPFLVAAVTGRALAASARRGGHEVVVLDWFADRDTRAAARAFRAVTPPGVLRFDRRALLAAARELAPPDRSAGLVPGSGFEARPGLLARLTEGRRMFGNPPAVIQSVKDPARLVPLLARLGIGHPEVRYTPPEDPTGWLLKHQGGAGGTHVRLATRRPAPAGGYFQRFQPGRTLSALFLADGRRSRLLGISEQWTAGSTRRPFLYGGAVSRVEVPLTMRHQLTLSLDALVDATKLVGLNGVDLLLHGDRWLLLEVNPRPTATMELYDPDHPRGLFDAHLRACDGALPDVPAPAGPSRAQAIVVAPARWAVPPAFTFPEWCRNIPLAGTVLGGGDPVCTVLAEAATAGLAAALAQARRAALSAMITESAPLPVGA